MDPAHNYCKATGEIGSILLVNRRDVRRFDLNGRNYYSIVKSTRSSIALDFDFDKNQVYFTDVATECIYRVNLTRTSSQPDVLVREVQNADGIAFDWVHSNLYWTDTDTDSLSVLSNYGGITRIKTLISDELDEPRAISVDPRDDQRWVYWSDWGDHPKIEKAGLDGSVRHVIVENNIHWPNGITLGTV